MYVLTSWLPYLSPSLSQVDTTIFRVGDIVRVMDDRGEVSKLQKGHGEWNDSMSIVSESPSIQSTPIVVMGIHCIHMCSVIVQALTYILYSGKFGEYLMWRIRLQNISASFIVIFGGFEFGYFPPNCQIFPLYCNTIYCSYSFYSLEQECTRRPTPWLMLYCCSP